jgi:hypothetical protein
MDAQERGHNLAATMTILCVWALIAAGCVAPAPSFGAYEGKAAASAASSLSAARTGTLAARTAARHRLFGPYVSVVLDQAEGDATSVAAQFSSIQPPDGRSDQLRASLQPLLDRAAGLLALMRIEARRGGLAALVAVAARLDAVAASLERFAEAHS